MAGDDMARIRALEIECNLVKMLDGNLLGDRKYALARFKPTLQGAISRKQQLLAKFDAVQKLQIGSLSDLGAAGRSVHLKTLGKYVNYDDAVRWCLAVLAASLAEIDASEVDTMWEMLTPDDLGDEQQFNPFKPQLKDVKCPLDRKLELARDHALNFLLLPNIQRGQEGVADIKLLRELLTPVPCRQGMDEGLQDFFAKIHCAVVRCMSCQTTAWTHSTRSTFP